MGGEGGGSGGFLGHHETFRKKTVSYFHVLQVDIGPLAGRSRAIALETGRGQVQQPPVMQGGGSNAPAFYD